MLADKIEAIGRAPMSALDTLARAVWQDFGTGKLTEAEADAIVEAIEGGAGPRHAPSRGVGRFRWGVREALTSAAHAWGGHRRSSGRVRIAN